MDVKINFIEPLLERAEDYSKTSLELIKLKAVGKTAEIAGTFASRGAVILVLSVFVVSINIGLALWLGDVMGRPYLGFFCVGGFYGIAGLILHFFLNDPIKNRVRNSLIAQMLN